jgi:DNA polymerase-4
LTFYPLSNRFIIRSYIICEQYAVVINMPLPINHNQPTVMHVDLNSCFATIEQQANPLLRGKPIVVAAYNSPNGCVVAPSIEAKQYGIKTGMTVRDARLLYPAVIVRSLPDIGQEIKRRFRREIGEWMVCSIGISTNRFLAKLAASLKKPDGLETIDHTNVLSVYNHVSLLDLNGINTRYEARLNASGIFTPMEFYEASLETLKHQVFQSILGYYWYLRLRGYEIDQVDFGRKSFGNTYAVGKQTNDPRELAKLLMKLCEKTGRRLRRAECAAQGVHVSCVYTDFSFWHTGRKVEQPLYTTREIYIKALRLLNQSGYRKQVRNLAVSVYDLIPHHSEQLEMFATKSHAVAEAMDKINDKYGEFVITPALMMGMDEVILDRIAFGGVKELEELYQR